MDQTAILAAEAALDRQDAAFLSYFTPELNEEILNVATALYQHGATSCNPAAMFAASLIINGLSRAAIQAARAANLDS